MRATRPRSGPRIWAAIVLSFASHAARAATPEPTVDFQRDVLPLLRGTCLGCHGPDKRSGGLSLESGRLLLEGGFSGPSIVPGKPEQSYLMQRLLGEGGEDQMPIKAPPLEPGQLELVRRWIAEGARVPEEPRPVYVPAPAAMRRLTLVEYASSVRDLLGPHVTVPDDLVPDTRVSGSTVVGAARVGISRLAIERYGRAAFSLARQAMSAGTLEQAIPCHLTNRRRVDGACLDAFLTRFGRRVFRRPLDDDERLRYGRLASAVARTSGERAGFEAVTAALLQSPLFLYRTEVGVPEPGDPKRRRLTGFELGTRMSYFLWGTPPDDALLDAAQAGELDTPEGLRRQAARLLDDAKAKERILAFWRELLQLHRLDRIADHRKPRERTRQPLPPGIGADMRTETLKVIEEVVFDPARDFREIFDSRATWVNRELAALYGLPVDVPDTGFVRVEIPAAQPRAGILGHASFLALHAHEGSSSPTRRGKFIREVLLCQAVPPPPPNVSAKLPEDHPDARPLPLRAKLDAHRAAPACAGCHKAMDPMGLAFESFDHLGSFRRTDAGQIIDTRGELDGQPFDDAGALGAMLRNSVRVGTCVARNLFRFAVGHLEEGGEEALIDELTATLKQDGFRFSTLIMAVLQSRGFTTVAAPETRGGS